MIYRLFKILIVILMLMVSTGCKGESKPVEYTAEDIVGAIADISDDEEGNVFIRLVDGRMFVLTNLKGEKGDQGETGEKGEQGVPGNNGQNGLNGEDGRDSYGDINIELKPEINTDSDSKLDIDIVIDRTKGIIGGLIDKIRKK